MREVGLTSADWMSISRLTRTRRGESDQDECSVDASICDRIEHGSRLHFHVAEAADAEALVANGDNAAARWPVHYVGRGSSGKVLEI